jgi:hypothetical protein
MLCFVEWHNKLWQCTNFFEYVTFYYYTEKNTMKVRIIELCQLIL